MSQLYVTDHRLEQLFNSAMRGDCHTNCTELGLIFEELLLRRRDERLQRNTQCEGRALEGVE